MPIPKYNEFFPAFMKCLSDGEVQTIQELRDYCADAFNLSEEDKSVMFNNGKRFVSKPIYTFLHLNDFGFFGIF